MVAKAIMKMKNGKAAGPSGIVAEMLKASRHTGVQLVADLANDMIRNGTIPSDWENSYIINIYKEKGDALIRDNCRGLKLLDHVMKVIERVMRNLGVEECIAQFVQAMYNNTRSNVRVNNTYCDEFGVKVGVHQGSVLSSLSYSSLYSKFCHVSSALGHPGSCCILMT